MQALVPLIARQVGAETMQTVNARDLYVFLDVKQRFNDWIRKRIEQYGFTEDLDFTCYYESSSENPNPPREYFISLGMAKELSMVERNAKGKEARQYFLACERVVLEQRQLISKTPQSVTPAQVALALAQAVVQIEERQNAMEARQDAQDMALQQLTERQPPPGRCHPIQWLRQYAKPRLPREVLDVFRAACKRREEPIYYRPDGFDNMLPYYSLPMLAEAYAEATKQLSFLLPAREEREQRRGRR